MKQIKFGMLVVFALLLAIPLAAFRWEPGIASEIDNRMLAENPFSAEECAKGGDWSTKIENYVNDRIGLREEMITWNTVLNYRLFGKMEHPNYCAGEDGYVFMRLGLPTEYGEFHEVFVDMVKQIQDYCEARGVPFLFAFEPAKTTTLQEFLPAGYRYDNRWVGRLFEELNARGIRYVDNSPLLREKTEAGEVVFNRKYDAGHWNDLGAYYGVNNILEAMKEDSPRVHVNQWEELAVSQHREATLPVSRVPVNELVPAISFPGLEMEDLTAVYEPEVKRDPSFQGFYYGINSKRLEEGSPRTLVFQGSYMNGKGAKYLMNALGEYIYVHDYQNIIDFDYYFNIFQPEYVVFEVAEYATTADYFDLERMRAMDLNLRLEDARSLASAEEKRFLPKEEFSTKQGEALTIISWAGGDGSESCVWAELGDTVFDLRRSEAGGWEVTVKNEVWDQYGDSLRIAALAGEILREYQ